MDRGKNRLVRKILCMIISLPLCLASRLVLRPVASEYQLVSTRSGGKKSASLRSLILLEFAESFYTFLVVKIGKCFFVVALES